MIINYLQRSIDFAAGILQHNFIVGVGVLIAAVLPIIDIVLIVLGIVQIVKKDSKKMAIFGMVCAIAGGIAYLAVRIYAHL